MNTLADLRRYLRPGRQVILAERFNEPFNKLRTVKEIQSNGIWFIREELPDKPSFLPLEKASLISIDDSGFAIHAPGYRDLTPSEQEIITNEPRDPVQEERDLMADTNIMWYRRKSYYANANAPYLFASERGKPYYDRSRGLVRDPKIKGPKELIYKFKEE